MISRKNEKLEMLKKYEGRAYDNLYRYSENYAMTRPMSGFENEWSEYSQEAQFLKTWIEEVEDGYMQIKER